MSSYSSEAVDHEVNKLIEEIPDITTRRILRIFNQRYLDERERERWERNQRKNFISALLIFTPLISSSVTLAMTKVLGL